MSEWVYRVVFGVVMILVGGLAGVGWWLSAVVVVVVITVTSLVLDVIRRDRVLH